MTQTDKEVLLKSLTTKVPHYTHGLTPPADVRLHGKATDKMMMQDALSPPHAAQVHRAAMGGVGGMENW